MFLKASLTLLCRPCCLGPATLRWPSPHARWLAFRACHLSPCNTPFIFAGLAALADPFLPLSPSSYSGKQSPDKEASKSGNLSLGFEEDDRRRSTLRELIIRVELVRNCGLDLGYAFDLCGSVCISERTNANSYCMLNGRYRGVFEADVNMVMARKGGCSSAAGTCDSEIAPPQIDTLSPVNECENDRSGQIRDQQREE